MNHAVVADGLTKRYGRTVALDRCSFAIPARTIVALVGPNGAGKSTLLHCATGLVPPTEGTITVLGGPAGDRTLPRVGFVAQDAPLYRDFTADELLTMGDKLNGEFDLAFARARLVDVGIPLDRRVERLSGGQRAQVALSLALAKRPGLLLLDEPLASLDPLARREFLSALMDAVAEAPMTVILSSHLIADLERVCDHLMLLCSGQVKTLGATDELVATHKTLIGPPQRRRPKIAGVDQIVSASKVWRQHRKQLLFAVAALVVLGAFFIGTGRPMHDRYERAGLPDCLPEAEKAPVVVDLGDAPGVPGGVDNAPAQDTPELDDATLANARCVQDARAFFGDYQNVIFVGLLLLVLPMLAGMFWGAPLVAREIEHGTHRLVWTQGVSRLRWATTKIGLVTIAALVITAIFAGMLTWWITPVIQTSGQKFAYIFFDIHGIVVFGYVTFALALGVFAGAVTGRLLPAMATTVVGFIGVRLVVMLAARDRYMATETRSLPLLDTDYPQMRNDLNGDWIVASHAGANTEILTVHPANQFWAFQAIETAVFAALAVTLLVSSIYWVRRRIT